MILFRPPKKADWEPIMAVADELLPWGPEQNQEWQHNRRAYDENAGGAGTTPWKRTAR